jgi:hypothetical protein
MIAFTSVSNFQVQLPAGNDNSSLVNLIVHIRDTLDCFAEYNISSPSVLPDTEGINNLIDNLKASTHVINSNPIVQLLAGGNQNIIAQLIISISQVFNQMNIESLQNTVSSKDHSILNQHINYDLFY